MRKTFFLFLLLYFPTIVFSQNDGENFLKKNKEKPPIKLYKIISAQKDTTYLDTSLNLQKEYKFNYLRKDNFELQEFANVGQPYNELAYDFDKLNLKPLFVAQSHHFGYREVEDMQYFNLPTPLTELYFKTAFKQGQQLDAFFSINTSNQFNFSIAYKGVRSLGAYQNSLTSTGDFRFTTNYQSKNKRYQILAHIMALELLNEENGGLTDESVLLFQSDDKEFRDRGRLDVKFEDAENELKGFRIFAKQEYELITKKDSTDLNKLIIGNTISFEDKSYVYKQDTPFSGFGDSYKTTGLFKKSKLEDFSVNGYAQFNNKHIGNLSAFITYTDYNFGYNSVIIFDIGSITNRLKSKLVQVGGAYEKNYKGFEIYGKAAINISGAYEANFLKAGASFLLNNKHKIAAEITSHSVAPNFNFLLNQSDYINYNWQNEFDNTKKQQLKLKFESNKIATISLDYTGIDKYTYFTIKDNDSTPTPHQHNNRIDYLKIKLQKEFKYRKFGLDNTFLFQNALSGEEVIKLPSFITRNTLYFEDQWFKKALFMQTGLTFKYYSEYMMNAYDTVLAEFYVQDETELGGYPQFDIFFNARVQQVRIYFKYENLNALFTDSNNYFSAPGYPFRDSVIRFGIVWNFLM
jgi:hypothetical protein